MSSTYSDLVLERQAVTEQLLRLRCIPAGMELFTAGANPPWGVITSALDTSDYMVLIMAGRYGSLFEGTELSYTEREYDYALARGVFVMPFIHEDLSTLAVKDVDTDEDAIRRGLLFRSKVSGRNTFETWSTAADLAQKVTTAVAVAQRLNPRPGWVRGVDVVPDRGGAAPVPTAAAPAPAPIRLDEHLVDDDDVRKALSSRAGSALLQRRLDDAERGLRTHPLLSSDDTYFQQERPSGFVQRETESLEAAAELLVRLVASTARWGNEETDRFLLELVENFGNVPLRGGFSSLIELAQAPAVLLLDAAAAGASAGRRDGLLGALLGNRVELRHLLSGKDLPAVAVLNDSLMYHEGWPGRQMRRFFMKVLGKDSAWSGATLDRAVTRWEYFAAVSREYYAATAGTYRGTMPYLQIEDAPDSRNPQVVVGRQLRKQAEEAGAGSPIFASGFCGTEPELFHEAALTFEGRYARWGDEQDWAALPPGGGSMPTGPHYPGER